VQLHQQFGFADAAGVVGYLARLGISHLYCSPYLQAVRGSTHGYDIVDFQRLNEDLGGGSGHTALKVTLEQYGLGQMVDIVPNHMAAAGPVNRWWWDILENGPSSRYADYFDIEWRGPNESGRETVLAPILGDHYGRLVDRGELRIEWQGGSFIVRYHDHELPLSPLTFDEILAPAAERSGSRALAELAGAFGLLPHASDRASSAERHRRQQILLERLAGVRADDPSTVKATEIELNVLNEDPDRLDRLLRRQNYRLAFWRTAAEELDYRRFFNIESLVGLREEQESVFADTHRLWLGFASEGSVQGLRVDHVDGLRHPAQYLTRLRAGSGGVYTVVEKILGAGENLPEEWPVDGTTGYDFIYRINNLFVDSDMEADATRCYQSFTGEDRTYEEIVSSAKQQVLEDELASEVGRLNRVLMRVCDAHRRHRDRTRREVREAVEEILIAFPVYRTYVQPGRAPTEDDTATIATAVRRAAARRPHIDPELLTFVGELLLLRHDGRDEAEFALRFPQVSAPLMAKGVEDTAFYRFNRLISLNEVGGAPDVFGRTVAEFHDDTMRVGSRWPRTMLTLSTHDTKRSADVRARIHLLSEQPDAWGSCVERLAAISDPYRTEPWPDRNAEYLLYQTLVGAWPIDPDRVASFMHKATREAKVYTSWVDPVAEYDDAVTRFVHGALGDRRFVDELDRFLSANRIAELGRVNSLIQTTLLLTCPGVADLYQGTELWDLSLVDPDNRRPVDYHLRDRVLSALSPRPPTVAIKDDEHGVWKLWLIRQLLEDRHTRPGRYDSSRYEPLEVKGPGDDHVVAFGRGDVVVVVPRLIAGLDPASAQSRVALGPGSWTNVLTGGHVSGGQVQLTELMAGCPVAVLSRGNS
jgi:(1->4)-alpha-D-glucan 1-alpha-D-glucosylmutase